jgi:hypothetical protein
MSGETGLPLQEIKSNALYVVYSQSRGLISEHEIATEATKSFASLVKSQGAVRNDAAIYKKERKGWRVF